MKVSNWREIKTYFIQVQWIPQWNCFQRIAACLDHLYMNRIKEVTFYSSYTNLFQRKSCLLWPKFMLLMESTSWWMPSRSRFLPASRRQYISLQTKVIFQLSSSRDIKWLTIEWYYNIKHSHVPSWIEVNTFLHSFFFCF